MSFYVRDITGLEHQHIKSNADLLVFCLPNKEVFKVNRLMFKNIYFHDYVSNNKLLKNKTLFANHNNDAFIMDAIDIETMESFTHKKKYESIEIIIPNNYSFDDIDTIVDQVALYYGDTEISIGLLISTFDYIDSHKDYLDTYGFYISKYIPEVINIELEEQNLFRMRRVMYEPLPKRDVKQPKNDVPNIKKNKASSSSVGFHIEESFKDKLIRYLNKSKKSNVEIYKKGGITRKLFSKIFADKDYNPKKDTICCLIIGMELCLDDALDLLNAAGYTLTNSLLSDVIIKKHIKDKEFDIEIINSELDQYGLTMLGWKPRQDE